MTGKQGTGECGGVGVWRCAQALSRSLSKTGGGSSGEWPIPDSDTQRHATQGVGWGRQGLTEVDHPPANAQATKLSTDPLPHIFPRRTGSNACPTSPPRRRRRKRGRARVLKNQSRSSNSSMLIPRPRAQAPTHRVFLSLRARVDNKRFLPAS